MEEPSKASNADAPCVRSHIIVGVSAISRLVSSFEDRREGVFQPKFSNSRKSRALFDAGIKVAAQISCEAAPNSHSLEYLRTQKETMGHTLSLGQHESMGWANHRHADDKDFDIR